MRRLPIQLLVLAFVLQGKSKPISDSFTYMLSAENISWPSKSVRKIYSASGRYKASNILPTRFQVLGLYAFMAFPRMKPGVPITLGRIPLLPNRKLPDVEPYPNWDRQIEGDKDAIQNAVDLYVDEKRILWVLDSGWVNTLSSPIIMGRPRVFGINSVTGRVIYNVDLSRFATATSKFQYVAAENSLNRPVVFVADADSRAVFVWDVVKEKGGLVPLPNLESKDDSLYMVLLRPAKSEPLLVFSHLSYPILFGISVSSLRMGQLGDVKNLGMKTGEMVILGTDNGSKMFFRWKGDRQIRVWDLGVPEGERGVALGSEDLHRTSTHVAGGGFPLLTWSLESNFPDYLQDTAGSLGASAVLRPIVKNS